MTRMIDNSLEGEGATIR